MTIRVLMSAMLLLLSLVVLTSCDPVYPPSNLKVEKMEPLLQGSSVDIEIIYPNTGGSIVLDWKNQTVEIVDGNDIVAISGLTITGLKPGTALIKVSATTVISDEAASVGREEKVYFTEIEIKVE
jgi:hypothetical protein